MSEAQTHRTHRVPHSGPSANKKKAKDLKSKGVDQKSGKNLKAYTYSSHVRARADSRRNIDREHRKEHLGIANRANDVPAPYVVAIVGPPGVGKSTLVKSLIKHYTKQNITDPKGPITVITGKKRRITFYECPNHLSAMIDCAKIADLVMLLVDASFGFEMETFEFLNILKNHGFPKVIGVLTHLDGLKSAKALTAAKKKLKHRFWTEVVEGAKMFFLSGVLGNRYLKREMINLARFISVTKFRPLIWKNTHPFVLCDRFEDLTDPALVHSNPKCDRTVSMYGYVRGTFLKPGQKIHILGLGDYDMKDLDLIPDPCPQFDKEKGKAQKRSLNEKEKLLYAPMTDLGGVSFDKDAMYVQIKKHQLNFSDPASLLPDEKPEDGEAEADANYQPSQGPGEELIRDLQKLQAGLDEKISQSSVRFFKHSAPVRAPASQVEGSDDSDAEGAGGDVFSRMQMQPQVDAQGRVRRKMVFAGDDAAAVELERDSDDEGSDNDDDSDGHAPLPTHASDSDEAVPVDSDGEGSDDQGTGIMQGSAADTEGAEGSGSEDEALASETGHKSGVWKDRLAVRAEKQFNSRGQSIM